MKVALILMPWYRRESPCPELAMSTALLKRQGHVVDVYDLNNEMFRRQFKKRGYWKFFLLDAPPEQRDSFFKETGGIFEYYADQILSRGPDVIIFKIAGKSYYCSEHMAAALKAKDPKKTVVVTGLLFPSAECETEFKNGPTNCFDFVVFDEDEIALPRLLSKLEKNETDKLGQRLKKDGRDICYFKDAIIEDMDTLPFYDFSDLALDSYKIPDRLELYISKGCIWRCAFCVDWLVERKYRSMSGERIFKEVEHQLKTHRIKHLRFCDKTINGDMGALEEFCDLMADSREEWPDQIYWSGDAMIRPGMTKRLLTKMYEAGCRGLGYGIESGSQEVVKKMGKRFSLDLAEEVLRNTHESGIHTDINILVGFPTETKKDFHQSLDFIKRNKGSIDEVRLTYAGCRVYSRSLLATRPDEYELLDTDTDFWSTKDGTITYEERARRAEEVCRLTLSLGIATRMNSRMTKKASAKR